MEKILALLPKAYFPGTVYLGKSSLIYLKSLENQRNLVVVSRSVWSRYGEKLQSHLSRCENEFVQFSSEPKKSDVESLDRRVKEGGYRNVIGIGGGSVIDLAKTAKLDNDIRIIAVPTTAGSGSEASRYSLVLNQDGEKEAIVSERLVPDVVLLDPGFLASLPRFETAYTSMDALSHALEGLVSRMANPFMDSLAVKAIDMVLGNLEKACENPGDMEARESLQAAGFLAGIVQSSVSVGIAHSFAHYFGPKLGIPHGVAVGCFLVECLRFNSARTDRYKKLDSSCTLTGDDFVQRIGEVLGRTGFYEGCRGLDFSGIDMEEAVRKVRSDVCTRTNPCGMTEDETRGIIERVLENVKGG